MAIKQGKIFTITSVKGGVGKTTTTLNLAGIFSNQKQKVLIVDMDLYGSAIAASLNISDDNNIYKLIDDLNNNRFTQIENYVVKYNDYIDVLPSPKDPRFARKINGKYLNIVFAKARMKYETILVDTNHILDENNLVTLDVSDEILYVLSNDAIDLKNLKSMVSIYKDMDKKNYKIILNNSKDKARTFFEKMDIKGIIKDNVDYIIPSEFYNRNYDQSVIDGKIMTLDKKFMAKNKNTAKVFEMIVASLLKEKK